MRQRAGFALLARAAAAAAAAAARGPASAPLEGSVASLLAAASLRSEFRKTWQAPISAAFSSFADAAVSADDETPTPQPPQPPPPPRPIPRPRHSSSSSIPPPAKAIRRAGGAGTDAASLASWKRGGGALPALAKGRKGGGSCGGGASGFGAAGAGGAGGTGTAGAKAAAAAENDAALLAWQQLQKLQQQLQQQQQKQKRKLQRMQEQQRRMRNAAAAEDDDVESGGYLDDDDDDDDDDGRSDDERRSEEDEDERSDSDAHGDNVGPAHPFTARAFYVGTPEAEAGLRKLRSAAAAASLPCVWDEAGNVAFCLTPGAIPTTAATTTSSSTKNAAAAKEAPPPPASPPPPPPPLSRDTPLPHAARYVAVFGSMGAVVFFNGAGYERALWRALAGGDLIGGGKGSGLLGGGGGGAAAAAEKKAGRAGKGSSSSSSSIVAAASISSALSAAAASSSSSNPPHDQPTDDVRLFVCPELRSPLRLNARLPASAIEGTIGNSGSGRPGGGAIDALLLRSARPAVIQTVACVAAQSVALHHYESRVDAELASFRSACAGMAATGSFRQGTPKEDLLRAVAANNVMLAAIMGGGSGTGGAAAVGGGNSSLDGDDASSSSSSSSSFNSTGGAIGVMSRLDVAWEDGEAAAVYEHLREDHEFALRLQNLELKLGFVQENLKYFLELMQARKSDTLEWTIIVLIAAEIGVSLFDMWSKAEGAAAAVVGSGGGGIV